MTRAKVIERISDVDVGWIVRCDLGLVHVGPRIAGEHLCRLVEPDGLGDFREVSEPIHVADRTRVLEVVREQAHYAAHRRAGGAAVDPLERRGA